MTSLSGKSLQRGLWSTRDSRSKGKSKAHSHRVKTHKLLCPSLLPQQEIALKQKAATAALSSWLPRGHILISKTGRPQAVHFLGCLMCAGVRNPGPSCILAGHTKYLHPEDALSPNIPLIPRYRDSGPHYRRPGARGGLATRLKKCKY